jgi:uncharacterized protein with von Willebrand factor type A (vWA) domain
MTAENIAISFARVLRGAGVSVPLDSVLTFVQALEVVSLEHREDVYWAGRATLVRKPEDHGIFDRAFAVFWEQRQAGHVPDEEPPQKITLLIDDEDDGADKAPEAVDDNPTLTLRFSATETLREKDFAEYSDDELHESQRLMQQLRLAGPPRTSLRLRNSRRRGSRHDLRRTVRASITRRRTHSVAVARARRKATTTCCAAGYIGKHGAIRARTIAFHARGSCWPTTS